MEKGSEQVLTCEHGERRRKKGRKKGKRRSKERKDREWKEEGVKKVSGEERRY